MSEDPQVWLSVFYWTNYDSEPTMEWPQAKYITYTKFIDKYQRPKIIGYIQFSAPIKSEMLYTIHPKIHWTEQRFSNSACMRYIEKINAEEGVNSPHLVHIGRLKSTHQHPQHCQHHRKKPHKSCNLS